MEVFFCILQIDKSANMFVHDHENKVKNPNDCETKHKSDNSSNNFAFHKSCDSSANPRCEWNDCKDNTYNISQPKVI